MSKNSTNTVKTQVVLHHEGKIYKPEIASNFYTKCNHCDLNKVCNYECIPGYSSFCQFWRKQVKCNAQTATYLHFKEVSV